MIRIRNNDRGCGAPIPAHGGLDGAPLAGHGAACPPPGLPHLKGGEAVLQPQALTLLLSLL